MRRFRYIWWGEEGRVESGSVGGDEAVAAAVSAGVCSRGGAGEEERDTMEVEKLGGGAPLTIWSILELDILVARVAS